MESGHFDLRLDTQRDEKTLLRMPTQLPSAAWPQRYEGNAVPGHAFGKVARITSSNSVLSTGFWKKAVAPACRVFCSLDCGSRAVKTITGILDKASLFCSLCRTTKPSPAGKPRSSIIRFGRSFCATEMAE